MNDINTVEVRAVKDDKNERPIPTAWRPVFRDIVSAFVKYDYQLSKSIPDVTPVSTDTVAQIRDYIEEYGETLVELPEETWDSSVCIWMGSYWDVLIDLWTRSEGRSDLVLSARVLESDKGFLFNLHMVYVP